MTAPDLKPCPFCGGMPHLYVDRGCEITCTNGNCGAEPTVWQPSVDEAIAAWNTRATPLASEIESDDLEEVFEIGNGYGDQTKIMWFTKLSSVSVGDIIKQGDELYMVEDVGFKKL